MRMAADGRLESGAWLSTAGFLIEGHGMPCPYLFKVDDGDGTDGN